MPEQPPAAGDLLAQYRLDRSIGDVIAGFGIPVDEPTVAGTSILGLHFRDFMDDSPVPIECWWWFVDGRAVYVATELLPPRGSTMARSAYQTFKNTLRETFGAPTEESPLVGSTQRRVVHQAGDLRVVMELLDVDGDPRFRIEISDPGRVDSLPSELRPNPSLPEHYTPPPPAEDPDGNGLGHDEWTG
jgi:hypothetical protein